MECTCLEDGPIFHGGPEVPGLLTVEGLNDRILLAWDEVGAVAQDMKAVNIPREWPWAQMRLPWGGFVGTELVLSPSVGKGEAR